jgi:diacylglycerol kinase (ATP)
MADFLLITNPGAGTNERPAVDAAADVLRTAGQVEIAVATDALQLDEVVSKVGDRAVVVAGGDGTLHMVVNALFRASLLEPTRLGLVPLGTGNDFARGVGIPLDPEDAARVVIEGDALPVDLITDDEGTVIVNNAHLGVGAQASRKATKWKPRLGRLGYAAGALSAGLRPEFLHVDVFVDGKELTLAEVTHDRVAQVAIGNGSRVGGGTELIPGAHPADRELVVIVSRAVGPWRRVAYLARLRGGSHHFMKEVTQVRGRSVTVEGQPFYVVADGEISGPHTRRCWELRTKAVTMMLPGGMGVADPLPPLESEA